MCICTHVFFKSCWHCLCLAPFSLHNCTEEFSTWMMPKNGGICCTGQKHRSGMTLKRSNIFEQRCSNSLSLYFFRRSKILGFFMMGELTAFQFYPLKSTFVASLKTLFIEALLPFLHKNDPTGQPGSYIFWRVILHLVMLKKFTQLQFT